MLSCCNKKAHPLPKEKLTQKQKNTIKEVWDDLTEKMEEVGLETFLLFFNTHPEAQDSFLVFKDIKREDLGHSTKLKEHGLKVTSFVDRCVNRLDEPEAIEKITSQLGRRHEPSLLLKYQTALRDSYIDAIKGRTTIDWNNEYQEAWTIFFNIIQKEMVEAACKSVNEY